MLLTSLEALAYLMGVWKAFKENRNNKSYFFKRRLDWSRGAKPCVYRLVKKVLEVAQVRNDASLDGVRVESGK